MSRRVVTIVLQRKLVKSEQTSWPGIVIEAGSQRRKFPHSATVAYPVTKSGFRAGQPQRTPTVRSSHPGVEVDRTSGARRCPGNQSE
ncbi:hypothetical protein PDJAM_G00026760 [Pangasius djambal]|uniref:Uncharacterized protein n=1 Tax=Pangasius djambal TaxID=1691987 RepID=A0ACC5YPP7_9TELE|nr:hypothetical protein [Pangasius djambal]